MATKHTCQLCGRAKSAGHFRRLDAGGHDSYCVACRAAYAGLWQMVHDAVNVVETGIAEVLREYSAVLRFSQDHEDDMTDVGRWIAWDWGNRNKLIGMPGIWPGWRTMVGRPS